METSRTPLQSIVSAGAGLLIMVLLLGGMGLFATSFTSMAYERLIARDDQLSGGETLVRTAQVAFRQQVHDWKNILLRGQDKVSFDKYHDEFMKEDQRVEDLLKEAIEKLRAGNVTGPIAEIEKAQSMHAELDKSYNDALKRYRQGDTTSIFATDTAVRGMDRPTDEQIERAATAVDAASRVVVGSAISEARERYVVVFRMTVVMMLAAAAVVGALLYRAIKGQGSGRVS